MYNGRMTKREKEILGITNTVFDRYESIGKKLTPEEWNNIWFALEGIYDRDGYDEAKEYALSAKIV